MTRATTASHPAPSPRRSRLRPALPLLLCAVILAVSPPARGADLVDGFALSAGAFNVLNGDTSGEAGFELRIRPLWEGAAALPWVLRPAAGAMATTEGALYGYLGFRLEIPVGERWTLTPQTAAGAYDRGDDKELGGSLQFRSGLELAYEVNPGNRVGAVFYHLSNAGFDDRNPGSESLVLFWSWH